MTSRTSNQLLTGPHPGAADRQSALDMLASEADTIAAVATPPGLGAIAIVRLSGPSALTIVRSTCRLCSSELRPRTAYLAEIAGAEGEPVDQGVLTFFPSPHSYTGEDVVEISCHGGHAAVRGVLRAVLDAGARPAEPGEFTKRAFIHGKLDLAQAESVNHLIRARTGAQLQAARHSLEGALSDSLRGAADQLTRTVAGLEASIDFPEDVDDPDREPLAHGLEESLQQLRHTLQLAERGRLLGAGIRVAIAGRPNVGKSSLLNLLAGRPRAIVSDIPGTTRDFLEETVEVAGLPVVAIDTAGLRETADPVEQEGTRRAVEALERADVALIVLDASKGITTKDRQALADFSGKAVAVWNKIDLAEIPPQWESEAAAAGATRQARICALTGDGLPSLESAIVDIVSRCEGAGGPSTPGYFDEALAASERQVTALREACDLVAGAVGTVRGGSALDLAAIQIQAARARIGAITGENVTEGLIDEIFSSFCIGK